MPEWRQRPLSIGLISCAKILIFRFLADGVNSGWGRTWACNQCLGHTTRWNKTPPVPIFHEIMKALPQVKTHFQEHKGPWARGGGNVVAPGYFDMCRTPKEGQGQGYEPARGSRSADTVGHVQNRGGPKKIPMPIFAVATKSPHRVLFHVMCGLPVLSPPEGGKAHRLGPLLNFWVAGSISGC